MIGIPLPGIVLCALFLILGAPILCAQTYIVKDLGTLGGGGSLGSAANAINSSGQVVGYSFTAANNGLHATLFSGTGSNNIDLGGLAGAANTNGEAYGINDSGQIIGHATSAVGNFHATLFSGTGSNNTDLGTLGGTSSLGRAINNDGQLVGQADPFAALFSGTGSGNLDLGGGSGGFAYANNSSGQIVGRATTTTDRATLFSGTGSGNLDLGTLGGFNSYAYGINDSGQIVGGGELTDNSAFHAVLFSGTGVNNTDLGTLGGTNSYAYAINNSGVIVGNSQFATVDPAFHAFVYSNGTMQDLNDLVVAGSGVTNIRLQDLIRVAGKCINDAGQIAAVGDVTALGASHAILLTPGSAPPTITSPRSATATVSLPFSYQFEATGASSLAVDDKTLPQGLSFDPALRAIVGSPAITGTFQVGLSASNTTGTTNATLVLTVQPFPTAGPVIISATSATGRTGSPFHFQVLTSGGSPATQLSATSLPPGLSADPQTGEISGTATSDGSSLVTLMVTDAGITNTATLQLTFTSDPAVPVIVSPNSALLFPGLDFRYVIEAPASDSSDPVTYSEIGPLPPGLGLDQTAGIISGTPNLRLGLQPTPALAGGVVTNVQIFACNSSGCGAQGLFFLLPTGAANISTPLSVGTGDNVLIGGFITQGNAPMKLVVRGIGPSLPLGGLLANPYLELHSGAVTLASNDNWKDNLAGGEARRWRSKIPGLRRRIISSQRF